MNRKAQALLILLASFLSGATQAATDEKTINVDEAMVQRWNQFANKVLVLHRATLEKVEHRKQVRNGGYTGDYFNDPDFYIEETSFAKSDGRLLSRVLWEKDNPGNVHVIEVYVYDKDRRLVRDYLVAYLPWGRNAPIQAFVNLHVQAKSVTGFRQFDASGVRIYEQCNGEIQGHKISISLEPHEIDTSSTGQKDYRHCFANLPAEAGVYLDPQ